MFDSDARSAGEAELLELNAADGHPKAETNEAAPATSTRYRDKAMSWLALGALLATWHMPTRVDRPAEEAKPRIASRTARDEQLWIRRATESRSWIERAPHGVHRLGQADARQPEFSSLASVRTARRWLRSL